MYALQEIHALIKRSGVLAAESYLALGPAVLVGHIPGDAADGWAFRTGAVTNVLPPRADGSRLHAEMKVWPLRKSAERSRSPGVVLVGRSTSNDVVIPHSRVSKLHARITSSGANHVLQDAGSSTGTLVNTTVVGGTTESTLRSGDVITLGPVSVTFFPTRAFLQMLEARASLDGR